MTDLLYEFGNWLGSLLKGIFDFALEALKTCVQYLCDFFKWFFYELQQIAWDTFMSLAGQVFKDNPYAVSAVEWSDNFHTTMNCFLPLNEFFAVVTVLLTVWVTCLIIKVTLKLIPTIY